MPLVGRRRCTEFTSFAESKFSDWLIWVDVPIIVVVTLGNVYVLCGTFDEEQVDLDTARSPDPEPLLGSIQNEGEAA